MTATPTAVPTLQPTDAPENLWWLGVILGLLGSIAINTGRKDLPSPDLCHGT